MERKSKFFYLVSILSLTLTSLVYGKEATINTAVTPAIISVGEVSGEWRGVLEIPIWAKANASLVQDTRLMVEEKINSFRFKLDWRGNNTSGFDEKATIIIKLEKESYPYSNRWELVYVGVEEIISNRKSVDLRTFLTPPVIQTEPEVRYKIVARVDFPIGSSSGEKVTFITIGFSSGSTYTYLPYLLLTILHDPNGDKSYTGIISQTAIKHTLGIKIGEVVLVADMQPELTLKGSNGNLEVKPLSRNSIKVIYTPLSELKSELNSSDPSLIGPGLGDIYVIAKNLPLKFNFSKAEKGVVLYFKVVSPQEAGLAPGKEFDIITIPSAVLRSYEDGRPIFDTWRNLGIEPDMRTELIDKNIGWDNMVTLEEKKKVIDLGTTCLNAKEKRTKFRYTPQSLIPITLKVPIEINPVFTQEANIITQQGKTQGEILFNHEMPDNVVASKNVLVELGDKDCKSIPGDFFTYNVYLDRQFGTLLFITQDDKSKPANSGSLHYRSLSSNPNEYWTGKFECKEEIVVAEKLLHPKEEMPPPSKTSEISPEIPPSPREEIKIPIPVPPIEEMKPPIPKVELPELPLVKEKTILKPSMPKVAEETPEIPGEISVVEKLPVKEEIEEIEEIVPEIEKGIKIVESLPTEEEKIFKEVVPLPVEEAISPLPQLTNGDFKSGLKHWYKTEIGGGKRKINVIKESKKYPNVLEFKRTNVKKEKGELGIKQILNMDISEYVYVVIKADVKVIYASLKNDGSEGGDYPVTIELEYEDAQGNIKLFKRGFLYRKEINYPEIGKCISMCKWYPYTSPNLIDIITPKPRVIKGIKIYGSGMAFEGRVANLQLICKETLPFAKEAPFEVPVVPEIPKEEVILPKIKLPESKVPESKVPEKVVPKDKVEKLLIPTYPVKLLTNGNFTMGLKNWEKIEIGKGINKLIVINENDEYPNVLEFTRVATKEGKLGVSQSLWMPVANFISLVLMADVKIIYSFLFNDSESKREYPIILELEYMDIEGNMQLWKKGFKSQGEIIAPEVEEIIKKETWHPFTSENLIKQLSPKPQIITKINVYGSGLGFWAKIANIQLIGE